MRPSPVDPYGIAKVAAEETLKVLAKVHDFDWNIAVPHNIVGEGQKMTLIEWMSIMLNRNLQGLPSIIYGDGNDASYIDDCINCLMMGVDPAIRSETKYRSRRRSNFINDRLRETGLNYQPITPAGLRRLNMPLVHQTKHEIY